MEQSLLIGLFIMLVWAAFNNKNGILIWFFIATSPGVAIWICSRLGIGNEYVIAHGEQLSLITSVYGLLAFFVGVTAYTVFKPD
jgi:hypothetical protein